MNKSVTRHYFTLNHHSTEKKLKRGKEKMGSTKMLFLLCKKLSWAKPCSAVPGNLPELAHARKLIWALGASLMTLLHHTGPYKDNEH